MNSNPQSFRDPCGQVFTKDGTIFRGITENGIDDYRLLMQSGLYDHLVRERLLIPHLEVAPFGGYAAVLQPEPIPCITYPWEWCPEQLRRAGIVLLKSALIAITHGMIIKDAPGSNIAFRGSSPVLIDTLSFTKLEHNRWSAYLQFCRHFLHPLLLSRYGLENSARLALAYPDGIPVDAVKSMLPWKSLVSADVLLHVMIPSIFSSSASQPMGKKPKPLVRLLDQLSHSLTALETKKSSAWSGYSSSNEQGYISEKCEFIKEAVLKNKIGSAIDIGANTGFFSQFLAEMGIYTIAIENDSACLNALTASNHALILPVSTDIANPPGGHGWMGQEHLPLTDRLKADLCLALAITHHLLIHSGIPFVRQAAMFAKLAPHLVVEFVPPNDPKVIEMTAHRNFTPYSQTEFETAFSTYFVVPEAAQISDHGRLLYSMRRK